MQNFTVILEKTEEGGFVGWILEWPEVMCQGNSAAETKNNLMAALELLIKDNKKQSEQELLGRQVMYDVIKIDDL